MIVTIVDIHVKSAFLEEFIEATSRNQRNSVREPGNLRFDFLQDESDPCHFYLYEAYESDVAATEHKCTEHYKLWKESVEPFMDRPRVGTRTKVIEPNEIENWKQTKCCGQE